MSIYSLHFGDFEGTLTLDFHKTKVITVMRALPLVFLLALFSFSCSSIQTIQRSTDVSPLVGSTQLLLMIASDWKDTTGVLNQFQRNSDTDDWIPIGDSIPVIFGKKGLGWGSGIHPLRGNGPKKVEGDGRTPAGVFRLPFAFGYASQTQAGNLKIPYEQMLGISDCVDDTSSEFYNNIVRRDSTKPTLWNHSEKMLLSDDDYRWGVFIAHNSNPATRGGGSCIFLHVASNPDLPTTGCTAMSLKSMEEIIRWLDAGEFPVLVQLTSGEYEKLKKDWNLP